jgi:hypothetical protein
MLRADIRRQCGTEAGNLGKESKPSPGEQVVALPIVSWQTGYLAPPRTFSQNPF